MEKIFQNTLEQLEIYIDYEKLKAQDLAKILSNLSYISHKIAEDYFARFDDYKGGEYPSLDIDTINTGGSIKFTLVEGWKPVFTSTDDADIVIGIPKAMGIPVLIGGLLVYGVYHYQDMRNKYLDNQLKEIEIELKKIELAKAIALNNKSSEQNTYKLLSNYIDNKVPEIKPVVVDTIKSIINNPNIIKFSVNNIELKENRRME